MYALSGLSNSLTMDVSVPFSVKKEISSEVEYHHAEEIIIPDLIPSERVNTFVLEMSADVSRTVEDYGMERAIKIEPSDTSNFIQPDNDLENPYECFECGLDCKSQKEMIDHYESVHSDENSLKSENNGGNSSPEASGTVDDWLTGDVAPDSPDKTANVEGAQNDATPHEVLLLYSCPCCGHSSIDWNHLAKHMEKHIQVNCLSCSNCMYIFSRSYSLKGYTGRDASDNPHVCCHCPFKTQWYQVLKDHCVGHHKNIAAISSSNDLDQDCTTTNDSNLIDKCTPQATSVLAASKRINSQSQNSISSLKIPYNESQTGYMVFGNSVPSAVGVNSFTPGMIQSPRMGSCGVNVVPPGLNLNPMIHLALPTEQKKVLGKNSAANTLSNSINREITPRLIPKLENPTESNQDSPPILPVPKSTNRTLAPKVPVNELLKKWSFPNAIPKHSQMSLKASEAPPEPAIPLLLTGVPPSRAPKGSKSRRGVKKKPCPYCPHLARDTHSLKTHILTHTKEKPFACEFCEYRATQRGHIQKHMVTHLNGNRRGRKDPLSDI